MRSVSRAEERRRDGSGPGLRAELSATLALAAPLAAGNLAQMAMSVTTTVMVGRLGGMPLAAVGLGGMFYFTGGIVLQGVLFAVSPLAAHALGAGDRGGAGRIAGAGLALAMMRCPSPRRWPWSITCCGRSATMPRSPPRSDATCAPPSGECRRFSAMRCCAACSLRCRIPARS